MSGQASGIRFLFIIIVVLFFVWGIYTEETDEYYGPAETLYERAYNYRHDPAVFIRLLKSSANKGHVRAQFELGEIYRDGLYERAVDLPQSVEWFQQAADQGYPAANLQLGLLYHRHFHDGESRIKARKLFFQAGGAGGLPLGMYMAGRMLLEGDGGPSAPETARDWLKKAAALKHPDAMLAFSALEILHGENLSEEDKKIHFQVLEKAYYGQMQEPLVNYYLGYCYQHGFGTEVNLEQAIAFYQKAALQDVPLAHVQMANLLLIVQNSPENVERAEKHFAEAARMEAGIHRRPPLFSDPPPLHLVPVH